jgi:acyl-[acyl carrier protein]--UDP-N-acetylglucosamine O-acyltransferase
MPSDKEKDMHAAMHQRVTVLEAIRARMNTTTVDLFTRIGRRSPVQQIRYQIVGKGPGAYQVTERSTGRVVGERNTWKEASNFAQEMESRADAKALIEGSGFES